MPTMETERMTKLVPGKGDDVVGVSMELKWVRRSVGSAAASSSGNGPMAMRLRVIRKQQENWSSGGDWRVQRLMGVGERRQAHSDGGTLVLVVETGIAGERGGISNYRGHGGRQARV
jgi:hypothetical protein